MLNVQIIWITWVGEHSIIKYLSSFWKAATRAHKDASVSRREGTLAHAHIHMQTNRVIQLLHATKTAYSSCFFFLWCVFLRTFEVFLQYLGGLGGLLPPLLCKYRAGSRGVTERWYFLPEMHDMAKHNDIRWWELNLTQIWCNLTSGHCPLCCPEGRKSG